MPPLGTGGGQERLTLQELKLPQLTGTWRPQGKGAVSKKGTALKGTVLKGTIFKSDGEVEATQGRGGALATMAVETHTRQGGAVLSRLVLGGERLGQAEHREEQPAHRRAGRDHLR